jgi:uncharacterized protein (TIGR03382 family)
VTDKLFRSFIFAVSLSLLLLAQAIFNDPRSTSDDVGNAFWLALFSAFALALVLFRRRR